MHTPDFWQSRFPAALLWPLALLFRVLVACRRWAYRRGLLRTETLPVPVVVIGNLTAGGAGKTPTTQFLAQALRRMGWQVGIVSRGYGGRVQGVRAVTLGDEAAEVGDEPLLLARSTDCPVYVGRDRVAAARALLADHPTCTLLLCDDGLQHYRLGRCIEIAVVDGQRGLQNGWPLPAGPLREPLARLATVDAIVVNGVEQAPLRWPPHVPRFQMQLTSGLAYRLGYPQDTRPLTEFAGVPVVALAGIAHPERFFSMLEAAGLVIERAPRPDHHAYHADEASCFAGRVVLTTEKDAVKLQGWGGTIWVVPVTPVWTPSLADWLVARLAALPSSSAPVSLKA
jgi:tetraacyldisaccharide 4'-kinase